MTLPELVARIRNESPAAAGNLDDRTIQRILRAGFAAVAHDVGQSPDGVYKAGGLGAFRVRTVASKDPAKAPERRVLFKATPPKAAAK